MHSAVSGLSVWERWKEATRLVVLEAFEDSATGARIKEFRHDLLLQLGHRCQIIEHVWLSSMFRLHELQEIAAEEAAAADLVVIAAHEAESLPDEVQGWLDLWLRQAGGRNTVLLALLDSGPEVDPGQIEGYLQDTAKRSGMEFMVETRVLAR